MSIKYRLRNRIYGVIITGLLLVLTCFRVSTGAMDSHVAAVYGLVMLCLYWFYHQVRLLTGVSNRRCGSKTEALGIIPISVQAALTILVAGCLWVFIF